VPCNGFNHRVDCNCPWGPNSGTGGSRFEHPVGYWQSPRSYTTPNAHCPRCPARVYFYRSPFGGSVYFDSLGPPWPKHPCMDHRSGARFPRPDDNAGSRRTNEWSPLYCGRIHRLDGAPQIAVIYIENRIHGVNTLYADIDARQLDHRTPFLYRARRGGAVEISTLNVLSRDPGEVRFTARTSPPIAKAQPSALRTQGAEDEAWFGTNSATTLLRRPGRVLNNAYSAPLTRPAPTAPSSSLGSGPPSERVRSVLRLPKDDMQAEAAPKSELENTVPPSQAELAPNSLVPCQKELPRPVNTSQLSDQAFGVLSELKQKLRESRSLG
jgi:hypothetical protein